MATRRGAGQRRVELLGAVGLLWSPARFDAGLGLLALTIVSPVHIYRLQRPGLFPVPYRVLLLRLPLQVALLALIAWSTGPIGRASTA